MLMSQRTINVASRTRTTKKSNSLELQLKSSRQKTADMDSK